MQALVGQGGPVWPAPLPPRLSEALQPALLQAASALQPWRANRRAAVTSNAGLPPAKRRRLRLEPISADAGANL